MDCCPSPARTAKCLAGEGADDTSSTCRYMSKHVLGDLLLRRARIAADRVPTAWTSDWFVLRGAVQVSAANRPRRTAELRL